MRVMERIWQAITANPLAWLALAAFLVAEYGVYKRVRELTQVCHFVSTVLDMTTIKLRPTTDADKAASICYRRLSDPDNFSN